MNITSTRLNLAPRPQRSELSPSRETPQMFSQEPRDGWVSAGISVAGGVVALAGAMSHRPLLAAGGTLVTAAATALTAQRIQAQGAMDSAAWVSFAGGGALALASAVCLMQPSPQVGPTGPLPTLLKRLGVQAL